MADLVSHPDEVKVVSRRFGQGATEIDRYLELDGYKAVQKALAMEPDAIINEVKNSGLRGRGGAGFSTGMKWSFVPKQSPKPKYVLCNGDESEPGTCKDRLIFEHDPHAVIEGVMIAALAVGSQTGYIYIRGEYRYLSVIMQKAIKDAYARGFLGKNIFGSGKDLDIFWHGGAGAYEVGEESALMESLEGKRGIPRIRPPFPAVVGLWGGPTVINNAETLASVPHIILGGADWYCEDWHSEKRRDAAVLPERESREARRLRTAHGLQPEEDDLRRGRRDSEWARTESRGAGRIVNAGAAPGRDRCANGFRFADESRLDAGLGRRGGARRYQLHCEIRTAHHEVLPARELRMVHPLSRRHRLVEKDTHTVSTRVVD